MRFDKPYWGILGFCAILYFFPIPLPSSSHIDDQKNAIFLTFPAELGGWKGKDMEVDERTYEILETRNVLSRNYQNAEGLQMHLLMVGSHKDRRVAHPPEVCYLSSNYVIMNTSEFSIPVENVPIGVKSFLARNERNPSQQEHVLYLYKVGDRFTTNYYSQQLQFAMDRFSKRDSQVLLIRLAIPSKTDTMSVETQKTFKEFLSLVLNQIKASEG